MSDTVRVKGAYYQPGQAPQSWVDYVTQWQATRPDLAGQNYQTSWWGQPAEMDIPKESVIYGRRPDLENKWKRKDRMETQPYAFDMGTMFNLLSAYKHARELDPTMPNISAEQFTRLALEEGRSNFGYNQWDVNNKKQKALVDALEKEGHDRYSAGFAAALKDRADTAKRLNRDMFEVWNGTGAKARAYRERIKKGMYSVDHQDNQELRSFIKNIVSPQQTSMLDETWMNNPLMGDGYA